MGAIDELLSPEVVERLRSVLEAAAPEIRWDGLAELPAGYGGMSIRARADAVSGLMLASLGRSGAGYDAGASAVRQALAGEGLTGWMVWPVGETVVTLALDDGATASFDDALVLLAELTPRLTSEFPIRRMLRHDLQRSLLVARGWASHPDEHVRRLSSEGTRSYLPWAVRVPGLIADPGATVPILDALYADPSEYVRRSVANHLNDLARHAPDLVVAVAGRWMRDGGEDARWVVRHGLRTLVKKAHPGAMALLGFVPAQVEVPRLTLDREAVELPTSLEFTADLVNRGSEDARVAVDYVVHYVKANGGLSEKVFKLAVLDLGPGEEATVRKRHAFRQMTTRVHYPGTHALELQVNGERHARTEFDVLVPEALDAD
ncbi:DNA alkylation repair protein [Zafaria sp. J156]|uniref:DNA alkylation repair protein n=1 Tax=Zafaria sp. J156 TaxID=3116490 RepID=UPI002E76007A|nr:DNA alkylation repair protein [Zafaria sp. J156]MEE1619823.1 DNA alkylation repair protein [Zafaria sp. J156]